MRPFVEEWKDKLRRKWAVESQIKTLLDYEFITQEEYDYILDRDN